MLPLGKYLCTNPCSTCYLQRLVREKLSLILPMGLVTFHLAFGGWNLEWFWLCISHSSSYLDTISEFLKILQRKTRSLEWFPQSLKWYLLPHRRLLSEPHLPTLWLVCGALGRIRHVRATPTISDNLFGKSYILATPQMLWQMKKCSPPTVPHNSPGKTKIEPTLLIFHDHTTHPRAIFFAVAWAPGSSSPGQHPHTVCTKSHAPSWSGD
jgi:hypothetical protein